MSKQHREAGRASALSRRTALGEPAFRESMSRLGKLGGRPTWQKVIEKASENPVRSGGTEEVARSVHSAGPGLHLEDRLLGEMSQQLW